MNNDRISYLIKQYLNKKVTELELYELTELLLEEDTSEEVQGVLDQIIAESTAQPDYKEEQWEALYQKIVQSGTAPVVPLLQETKPRRLRWRTWAAAAVIILALGVGSYFMFFDKPVQDLADTEAPAQRYGNDIAPGGDKAILTLADGQQIVLDSVSGNVAKEGGVTVINLQGQLSYEEANGLTADVARLTYHTVSTPRGGQYQLVLQDGTRVWLNAASSLRFPTAFADKDRVVELTGEGYFEVARNREKPFKVSVNGMQVEVLGTHFNINSYEDEDAIRTTLLEGSVKVSPLRADASHILKPGEQAVLFDHSRLTIDDKVDLEAVMAWKNGYFQFRSADLQSIMRQLERWYDVEVVYEEEVPKRTFTGKLSRHMTLSQVLKILEQSGVHFRVQGKKLIVR